MKVSAHYSPRLLIHINESDGIPFFEGEDTGGVELNDDYLALLWHEYLHYIFALTPAGLDLFIFKVLDLLRPDQRNAPPDISWWPVLSPKTSADTGRYRLRILGGLQRCEETGVWSVPVERSTPFGSRKREDYEIGILDCIEASAEMAVDCMPVYYRNLAPPRPTEPVYTVFPALGVYYGKMPAEVFRLIWEGFFMNPVNPPDYVCHVLAGIPTNPSSPPSNFPASGIPLLDEFLRYVEKIQPDLRGMPERITAPILKDKESFDRTFVDLVMKIPPPPILLQPGGRVKHLFPVTHQWNALELHRVINAVPVLASLYPDLKPCPFTHDHSARTGLRCPTPCPEGVWSASDLRKPHCLLGNFTSLLDI